ncbi:MAG: hypothetical protein EXR72_23230 [Myxococcales bacterium]|nr:hypothetical protein [Myxococcales bacterium]
MNRKTALPAARTALLLLLLLLVQRNARAAEACAPPFAPGDVARCALAADPGVRQARLERKVVAGKTRAAQVWLPSNPVVSVSAAGRSASGLSATNVYGNLSLEIEVAGQRGVRLGVARAEAAVAERRLAAGEQEAAAQALAAWLELAAAEEQRGLAGEVARIADGLAALAAARERESLTSPLDADLAAAEAGRIGLEAALVERRLRVAEATLATSLGLDPAGPVAIAGGLAPLAPPPGEALPVLIDRAIAERGEVGAAAMERQVLARRTSLLRRLRIPNPTLSVYAQSDGFNERVIGGGISLPLPLPSPIGRTLAGEIAEAGARQEQGEAAEAAVRRQVGLEVARAFAEEKARTKALARFSPTLLSRARVDLQSLRDGIAAGQLSIRDALVAQRNLVELLQLHVEARLAHALAVLDLRHAAALPLLGGDR